MSGLWEKPVSHGDILKKVWKHLDLGVLQAKHPFHTAVFGTVAGGVPDLRVVVLRRFWRRPAMLAFHAHAGSPKIAQIDANPSSAWVFYHPDENFQARITGCSRVHRYDELADEQWEATSMFARRCYIGKAPGESSKKPTHGMPDTITDREPTPEESREGRLNFAVVSMEVRKVDVMELDVRGHRRSLFEWKDGKLETRWLTP